jgi:hypothetical protein
MNKINNEQQVLKWVATMCAIYINQQRREGKRVKKEEKERISR